MNLPDVVAVCVSSPDQAETIAAAIRRRVDAGIYPRELEFRVVHDPPQGRVGSGGGTIHALAQLRESYGSAVDRRSILLIHAGGESRRLPTYAPEGKLFAPVPVPSSTVLSPVLFDVQLNLYLDYPWREGELVVASGDVYLDFDLRSVRADRGSVCGFAAPADFANGSRHGVFAFDRSGRRVLDYLQKAPVETLKRDAALPGRQSCALDIGIVAFHGEGRERLRRAEQALGPSVAAGTVNVDLYVEIMTAALPGISLDEYHRRIAGQSMLDQPHQDAVFSLFSGLWLNGILVRDSTFLHFGSVADVLDTARRLDAPPFYDVARGSALQHEIIPDTSGAVIQSNCENTTVNAVPGAGTVYVEGCRGLLINEAGGENLVVELQNLDFGDRALAPGFCLDGRMVVTANQPDVPVVAVYHRDDTFKPVATVADIQFCGAPLLQWLSERGLALEQIAVDNEPVPADLWKLSLFPINPEAEHLIVYWDPSAVDDRWRRWFLDSRRYSLYELNQYSDPARRESVRTGVRERALRTAILDGRGWQSLPAGDVARVFTSNDRERLANLVAAEQDDLIAVYRRRTLLELPYTDSPVDQSDSNGDDQIEIDYLSTLTTPPILRRSVKPDQIVWARSPVRMDFGGGWTDTPPYTLREGGRVCNVAIDINGQPPVQVFCRPLAEPEIRFHSIDLGVGERITSFRELEDYRNPNVPFALPRAALCILGFTAENHHARTLAEVLAGVGGGVEVTLLAAIPKGSGLGTSSILGATLLAALERFFGVFDERHINTGELYRQVLQMEQMLTTGGGWQDQIGGVAGGVKYAVSEPGMRPELKVYQLDPWLFTDPDTVSRYTLYYTGATRLAKNILQDVVDGYNSMSPAYLFTVRRIAALADDAREAFALRDSQRFTRVVRESWRENCLMHPSTTNEEIEAMRTAVAPHYDAMKLLGAGGGGFTFFVSESADAARRLRDALDQWAAGSGNTRARVVDLALNQTGLQVTVS